MCSDTLTQILGMHFLANSYNHMTPTIGSEFKFMHVAKPPCFLVIVQKISFIARSP